MRKSFSLTFLCFCSLCFIVSASANLNRGQKPTGQDFSKGGIVKTSGLAKEGYYVSPEKTCFFKIPLLKQGFSIDDFTDGTELRATFKSPPITAYQIDIYRPQNCKTPRDFFNFEYKHENKSGILFSDYITEKFDMVESAVKLDIFVMIQRGTENKKKYPNPSLNMAYVMANDKFYRIFSVINWDDFPDEKGKRRLTDEELIAKGKGNILDLLSRLYIHTPEQNKEFTQAGKAIRERRESEEKTPASVSSNSAAHDSLLVNKP